MAMKLRITIDGKAYDAEVEIVESGESAPEYPAYPPPPAAFVPPSPPPVDTRTEDSIGDGRDCRSPVTGMVIKVNVEPGQTVQLDDVILVLESMKMEMQIAARPAGVVKAVLVAPGSSVKVNQVLVEFE